MSPKPITAEQGIAEGWFIPNPSGLCMCGCGGQAPFPRQSDRRLGWVKGEPMRYIIGHSMTGKMHTEEARAKMSFPGESHPNYGKPMSEEQKEKIRATKTGVAIHTPEHRAALREGFKGAANPNWKGGITPANKIARETAEQKEWRAAVKERDDYTCQHCGKRDGGYLHSHHIKDFAIYEDLRTVLSNGITLCEDCHEIEHSRRRELAA